MNPKCYKSINLLLLVEKWTVLYPIAGHMRICHRFSNAEGAPMDILE